MPKKFFRERIVFKADRHIKAFVSECIDAVYVLGLFTELVSGGRCVLQAACADPEGDFKNG